MLAEVLREAVDQIVIITNRLPLTAIRIAARDEFSDPNNRSRSFIAFALFTSFRW